METDVYYLCSKEALQLMEINETLQSLSTLFQTHFNGNERIDANNCSMAASFLKSKQLLQPTPAIIITARRCSFIHTMCTAISPMEYLSRNNHRAIRCYSSYVYKAAAYSSPPASAQVLPSIPITQPITNSPTPTFYFSDYLTVTATILH